MKGYAEREVFSEREQLLLTLAKRLVKACPYSFGGVEVRCHELARAVGQKLELEHCDGWFAMVDHTWLWLGRFDAENPWRSALPNILDVYTPGALPQVQLVSMSSTALPVNYRRGPARDDIRADVVQALLRYMTEAEGQP